MKNGKFVFVLLVFFSATIFSQSWNNEFGVGIIPPNTKVESFADRNGNHIVYEYNGGIKYARISASGVVQASNTVIESEGSNSSLANIVSDGSNLFAIYVKNADIKVAKSSNLGSSWATNFSYWSMNNDMATAMKTEIKSNDVYISWAQYSRGYWPEDAHFIKFNIPSTSWSNYKNLTEGTNYGGKEPTVAISEGKVHTSYVDDMYGKPYSRDYIVLTDTWEASQLVPIYNYPLNTRVLYQKLFVQGNTLHLIYKANYGDMNHNGTYISHSYRAINGTTWTQDEMSTSVDNNLIDKKSLAVQTADGNIHIVFYENGSSQFVHKSVNGTTWSGVLGNPSLVKLSNSLKANGNDLYLTESHDYPDASWPMGYRQYDATPTAPLNFAGTSLNNHPKITWNAPVEPDVYGGGNIKVYRGYQEGGVTYWGLAATLAGNSTNWVDELVTLVSPKFWHVDYCYKVSTVDIGSKESAATAPVWYSGDGYLWKISNSENSEETMIKEYKLSQNYPNPFNPSTTINYQLAEKGYLTLKVYDVLGKVVDVLADGWQEAGNYSFQFTTTGKQLASGLYIYRLQATNGVRELFNDSKRMLLIK